MKIIKALMILAVTLGSICAHSQLNQVYPEVYAIDGVPGHTTYRIFAELDGPTHFVSSVFASSGNLLSLGGSGNQIWNSANGAITGDDVPTDFCFVIPEICYDSYVTIGWVNDEDFQGGTFVCGSQVTAIATPETSIFDASFEAVDGVNLVIDDGAWFTTNNAGCNDNGEGVGPDNKVLLAQVTIPSEDQLEYVLNVQVFVDGDGNQPIRYIGAPGTLGQFDVDGSEMGLAWPMANCLDETACNYNLYPGFDEDPDFCDYDCIGCTDSTACNYEGATIDDGSCVFPEEFYDCFGECLLDVNDNGICDQLEISGCTYVDACNYNSAATIDDNSCFVATDIYDCDGNCVEDLDENGICDQFENEDGEVYCGGNTVWDPETETCIEADPCPSDINGDNVVDNIDLLIFLGSFGLTCN